MPVCRNGITLISQSKGRKKSKNNYWWHTHSEATAYVSTGENYMTWSFIISILHLENFISMFKEQEAAGHDTEIRNMAYLKISVGKLHRKRLRGREGSRNIDCIL